MSGLPRDVIKWLQSLGLKHPYLNPQWDLANGVLIAEILGKHGKLFHAACIFKGNSLEMKVHNWALLKKVMEKMDLVIPDSLVEASMHCKHGAGKALLIKLFEQLTHWQVPNRQDFNYSKFFTDRSYHDDSPLYTRSTAVSAIRANFKDTEQRLNKDLQTQKAKSMAILKEHNRQVTLMKENHPEKFCHVEKMAEVALRRTPPPTMQVHLHPGWLPCRRLHCERRGVARHRGDDKSDLAILLLGIMEGEEEEEETEIPGDSFLFKHLQFDFSLILKFTFLRFAWNDETTKQPSE